jgi:transcription antitermination factor NusG
LWKKRLHNEDSEAVSSNGMSLGNSAAELLAGQPVMACHRSPRWYAVYTTARHEKRIAGHCGVRGIEHFLPLYRTLRRYKNGFKLNLELPVFPSYIFVHIVGAERVRVLEIPGVLLIVSRGRDPIALPDFEIESLRAGLHLRRFEPHPYLVVGERVRIRSGSMEGWEGVLVRKKNDFRVVLTLDTIMRSIVVEVDADELECVPPAGPPIYTDKSSQG